MGINIHIKESRERKELKKDIVALLKSRNNNESRADAIADLFAIKLLAYIELPVKDECDWHKETEGAFHCPNCCHHCV